MAVNTEVRDQVSLVVPDWVATAAAEVREENERAAEERRLDMNQRATKLVDKLVEELDMLLPHWRERLQLDTHFSGVTESWRCAITYYHEDASLLEPTTGFVLALGSGNDGDFGLYDKGTSSWVELSANNTPEKNWRVLGDHINTCIGARRAYASHDQF